MPRPVLAPADSAYQLYCITRRPFAVYEKMDIQRWCNRRGKSAAGSPVATHPQRIRAAAGLIPPGQAGAAVPASGAQASCGGSRGGPRLDRGVRWSLGFAAADGLLWSDDGIFQSPGLMPDSAASERCLPETRRRSLRVATNVRALRVPAAYGGRSFTRTVSSGRRSRPPPYPRRDAETGRPVPAA